MTLMRIVACPNIVSRAGGVPLTQRVMKPDRRVTKMNRFTKIQNSDYFGFHPPNLVRGSGTPQVDIRGMGFATRNYQCPINEEVL